MLNPKIWQPEMIKDKKISDKIIRTIVSGERTFIVNPSLKRKNISFNNV
jgi:hypothetical protein